MNEPSLDINRLSPSERLALIESIWNSLEPADIPITDAQREELDRRIDDLDRDGDVGIPWDEVRRRIRKRS